LALSEEHIDFITGLTHSEITSLIDRGHIQLDLFKQELAEVKVDNRRYILSINPELEARELLYLNNSIKRTDALVENIRKSYEKRCAQNEKNSMKQKENPKKYKSLKTEFTVKDLDGYKRRVAFALKDCGTSKYYDVKTIDNESFQVVFNIQAFDKSRSLCGKYVVCTSVLEQEMNTEQVRGQYKNLKFAEHAFRDLKSDNISIRPIYHRKERQTRGHVHLCMFAYAILNDTGTCSSLHVCIRYSQRNRKKIIPFPENIQSQPKKTTFTERFNRRTEQYKNVRTENWKSSDLNSKTGIESVADKSIRCIKY